MHYDQNFRSYYAILPANIRYDPDLPPNAKLLYGEITALCSEKGYCWASNEYFAKLYNVDKRSISRWISKLEEKKYIRIQINKEENGVNRFLSILDTPIDENVTPRQNCRGGIDKNVVGGIDKNVYYNNTNNNNTLNIKENIKRKNFVKPTLEELKEYCIESSLSIDCQYFYDYYESNGWQVGKNKMKDWKATLRNWNRRNQDDKSKKSFEAEFDEVVKKGGL